MSQATDMYAAYVAAEMAVLAGKIGQIGDRRVQLEDLPEIRKGRQEWGSIVAAENGGAGAQSIGGRPFVLANLAGDY